jgi:hypothetical protein
MIVLILYIKILSDSLIQTVIVSLFEDNVRIIRKTLSK